VIVPRAKPDTANIKIMRDLNNIKTEINNPESTFGIKIIAPTALKKALIASGNIVNS